MKKIISFEKKLEFPSMVGEITSISLEHTLEFKSPTLIEGAFLISGTYKLTEASCIEDNFNFKVPTEIMLTENIDVPNRVIINYGLPINSRNKTSKELSEIWQCTVNEGIEDAKKLIEEMANIDRQETSKEEKSKKIKVLVKEFVNN